jgi:hypothetical protein
LGVAEERHVKRVWDGEYEKQHYVLTTPIGEEVVCWPNAGRMCSSDGSGRQWWPCADCLVEQITIPEAWRRLGIRA